MPELTFEEKIQRQSQPIMAQAVEQDRKDAIKQRLESGAFSYDRDFIRTQASSQQGFYDDYERKWGTRHQGFLVEPPYQPEPAEMEIQERKLSYKEKKRRKKSLTANYGIWRTRLREAGAYGETVHQKESQKHNATVVDTDDTIYGLGFNRQVDQNLETYDIMNRTIKLGVINKRRALLFDEAVKGNENPIFSMYAKEIIALGPPLIPDDSEEMSAKVEITKKSEDEYKAFLARMVADPLTTIRDAISDTLFSFGDISEKMLTKEYIAQRFDQVKLLRDKLKAVTVLMELEGHGEVAKMTRVLQRDKQACPPDNVLFAKALYSRIDVDMRAALRRSGIMFKDDGELVDREDLHNAALKQDGRQSAALLRAVKNKVKAERHLDVERHWDKVAREMLLSGKKKEEPPVVPEQEEKKEEQKEEKKEDEKEVKKEEKKEEKKETKPEKREFKDTYNIAGAVGDIASKHKKNVTNAGDKKLFSRLFELGNQIALAVSDIDRELEGSEEFLANNKAVINARPNMESMLRRYIAKRKQQQLNLIYRAQGVINAMKYLAGAVRDLDENGNQVLRQQRYALQEEEEAKKKKSKKKAEDQPEEEPVQTQAVEDELFSGAAEDAKRMASLPLSMKEMKKRLFEKFKGEDSFANFKSLYESVEKTETIQMLILSGKDILAMSFNDLFNELLVQHEAEDVIKKIQTATAETEKSMTFLYDSVITKRAITFSNDRAKSVLVKEYCKLREKIYALNKLKAAKPFGLNKTYDALMKENKTAQELSTMKKNELVSNMQFKRISDNMESYRLSTIKRAIRTGADNPDIYPEDERKQVEKLTAQAKKQKDGTYKHGESPLERITAYYNRKIEGQLRLTAKHEREYESLREKDDSFRDIAFHRTDRIIVPEEYTKAEAGVEELNTDALQDLFKEMQDREADLIDKQRKEKELPEKLLKEEEEQERLEKEEQERLEKERKEKEEKRKAKEQLKANVKLLKRPEKERPQRERKVDVDHEVALLQVEANREHTKDLVAETFDELPQLDEKDGVLGATKVCIRDYILSKDIRTFRAGMDKAKQSVTPAPDSGGDTQLSMIIKDTLDLLLMGDLKAKVVKDKAERIQPGLIDNLTNRDVATADISVDETNPDYIWFMNQLAKAKSLEDLNKLRHLWGARKEYADLVFTDGMDNNVYAKIDAFLYSLGRATSRLLTTADKGLMRAGLMTYEPNKDHEQKFDLKKDDKAGIYNFDQHQKGFNACWTASHTYVVNAYKKAHNIQGPDFQQETLKNPANFAVNPTADRYLKIVDDDDPASMSFNAEATNIREFLKNDRMGNAYTMADTVITKLPKTAEHHMVFTTFNLKKDGQLDPELKDNLVQYMMDKVQSELIRTKTPISLLYGLHYLSIVGVDRAKGCFLTMNSSHDGDQLNDYTEVTVTDLLKQDKFEMIYPEYLDDKNLGYLKNKFKLKPDLYDAEGRLNVDENITAQREQFMEQPQNMLHVHGYEFDLDNDSYDFAFESSFLNEQVYMPSHLDLPGELAKKGKKQAGGQGGGHGEGQGEK